jgi:hypothetical protein
MEILFSVLLGIGLSSAAGFRVFVPLLVVGLASRFGYLEVTDGFSWLASTPALIVFAIATAIEILAYYVPWVDNALDAIATPSATIAGVVLTAAVLTDVDPVVRWSLAILAGGGSATVFQGVTTGARQLSSLTTLGFANPVLATGEAFVSAGLALVAIAVPVAAVLLAAVLLYLIARRLFRRRHAAAA